MWATSDMAMQYDELDRLRWLDKDIEEAVKQEEPKQVIPTNPLMEFAMDIASITSLSREEASKEASALTGKTY